MNKNRHINKAIILSVMLICSLSSSAQEWTWIKGSNTYGAFGVYGILGTPAVSNIPGARESGATWTDNSGNLWLLGGNGMSSAANGRLNDLWKFDPTTHNWTWMHGLNAINQNGIYGVKGVSSALNMPGSRYHSVTWTDNSGNLWLFGGYGNDALGSVDNLNDLWKYNIASNQWTWVSGSSTINQYGSYGTIAVASVTNTPGARRISTGWKDNSGNLWLFSGYGLGSSSGPDGLNDLWKYDPVGNTWTWVKGSNNTAQIGTYGTKGIANSSNTPGTRYGAKSWKDNSGNLWLYSGYGYASSSIGYLNDVWKFNVSTSQWTWMNGSNTQDATTLAGTQSVPSLTASPGGRHLSSLWSDANDNMYVHGGSGMSFGGPQQLNDTWKYNCTTNEWAYVRGSLYEIAGNYGTASVTATSNDPGSGYSRMSWKDNSGNFWLFGGVGYDINANFSYLNELWKMNPCVAGAPINTSVFSGQNACTGSSATLSAISNTNPISWYSTSTSTTVLGTGTTYVTGALSSGTAVTNSYTYYASATNTCGASLARTPIVVTSNSIYPVVTTGAVYTVGIAIPNGATPNSDWYAWVHNFADPVPTGGIIVGMDLTCDLVDQGWGGSGAGANLQVADQTIGVPILYHSIASHTVSTTAPFPTYVYGGTNTFKMYFVGWSGWQGFISNAYLVIRYQIKPSAPINICQNSPINLKGYGAATYSWTGSVVDNVPAYPNTTQSYTVTGYNVYGCPNSAVQQVIVTPSPTLSLTGNTLVCMGASVTQSATITGTSHTFSWNTGSTTSSISSTPTVTTRYSAIAMNTLTGCSHTVSRQIKVSSLPFISVSASSNSFCAGQTTSLALTTNGTSYALNFDGIDDYVNTSAISTELGKADFSIEAWIKTTGISQGIVVFANANNSWETGEKCMYLDASGIPSFVGYGNDYILGTTPVNDGLWHHVAVVWDYTGGTSGIGKIYVDGADNTYSVSYWANNNNNVGTFKIGRPNYYPTEAPNYFTGLIDDVRIWNVARTASQISTNRNSCLLGNESGLQAYYSFEDGTGYSTLSDQTGLGNTGTLTNMSTSTAWLNGVSNCSSNYVSYSWLPGGAITPSVVLTPSVTNVYTVTVTDNYLCNSTTTKSITVNPSPLISVNSGGICEGGSFTISPSGAVSYTFLSGSTVVTPTASASFSIIGTSAFGCISSSAGISNITVNPLPVLSISGPVAVCSGSSVAQTVSGANSYSWNTGSTNALISVSPTVATTYSVIGMNTVTGCSSSTSKIINIGTPPVVNVNGGNVCQGGTFTLSPSGASTYTFSNGTTTVSSVVSPLANTSYYVSGTSSLGCVSIIPAIANVIINPAPAIVVNSGGICAGTVFTMTPTGANTYTFSNGSSTVLPTANTSYSITGTNVLGCVSIVPSIASVTVNSLPVILASNATVCAGSNYSLVASGANTYTFANSLGPVSPWVSPLVNTTYSISGTNSQGCISASPAIMQLSVSPLPTVAVNSGTVCSGSIFTLTPNGASTYSYSSGSSTVSPSSNISYSVTGTSALGCISATPAVANVTVLTSPYITVNNGVICAGDIFTMTPSGASSYSFSSVSPTVSPTINSSYTVIGTNSLGCTSSNMAISNVIVNPKPTVSVLGNTVICKGSSTTLYATGANSYTWNGVPTSATQILSPTATVVYTVIGSNINLCKNTATVNVVVNQLPILSLNSGTVCPLSEFTIIPTGAVTYSYSSGSNVVVPSITSSYSVIGTDVNGCVSQIPAVTTITVINAISITASGVSLVCSGQPALLSVTGANSYTWSTGANSNTVAPTPSVSSTYSVVGAIGTCMDTALVSVNVNQLPSILVGSSSSLACVGESSTLTTTGAVNYVWSSGETDGVIIINPVITTNYTVVGIDGNGCSGKAVFTQSVSECLGIDSKNVNNLLIKLYPNPNNGEFIIEVTKTYKMIMMNALGQIMNEKILVEGINKIILDESKGIYFVSLSDGIISKTIKVIKE
ncbi:LamG-like jellyroll fold domain-containing protein [Aurantibacillus circumpalustris]|uniref:LamG-like jellyroll fold domain-containing protein n=1 Tax=Aurantibacillus circumpalustris TaxID=3036359 RepID=UPI00295A6628|nr:LamG-like jellyroll fold domain-containing protein [Aurantibacillus circumpalustris]